MKTPSRCSSNARKSGLSAPEHLRPDGRYAGIGFGLRAFAWDVQEVRHLREMLAVGVDALYSDHVDRMVAVVAEWRD